jgi:hypothetical protein
VRSPQAWDDEDELNLDDAPPAWCDRLHPWRQREAERRRAATPANWDASAAAADGSDDSGDDDLYAFAHAEAEAFPRAWDDARDDFEDDDVFE